MDSRLWDSRHAVGCWDGSDDGGGVAAIDGFDVVALGTSADSMEAEFVAGGDGGWGGVAVTLARKHWTLFERSAVRSSSVARCDRLALEFLQLLGAAISFLGDLVVVADRPHFCEVEAAFDKTWAAIVSPA